MPRLRTAFLHSAIALALVLLCVAGIGGAAAAATQISVPRTVQAHFDFVGLTPGVPAEQSRTFTVKRGGVVTAVAPFAPEAPSTAADFIWTTALCDVNGERCAPVDDSLVGSRIEAGPATVRVSVTLTGDDGRSSSSAIARITVADDGDDLLASTGVPAGTWLILAIDVLGAGLVLLLIGLHRRRRRNEDES